LKKGGHTLPFYQREMRKTKGEWGKRINSIASIIHRTFNA
jgi:hypothetical protein